MAPALLVGLAGVAHAQPPSSPATEEQAGPLSHIDIHGFVSEGGFVSTDNEFIGASSRGSLKFAEAAINVSTEVADRLRFGVQVFARNYGRLDDGAPRIDWAMIDYRWRPWLGLEAGIIKMPFGLSNASMDVDAARLAILMPASVYPLRNRDALISHTGFALSGTTRIGGAGALEYRAWLGTLTIPRSALELSGAELESVDTRYVTGGQLFWSTPLEGLRVGASLLRASIDFDVRLDPATVEALVAAELVPADYDGRLTVSQRPLMGWVASAELQRGAWLVAAEYGRWLKHQQTTLPDLIPAFDEDSERFYGLIAYRISRRFETGGYLSVIHLDADDRRGRDARWAERYHAFQRDLAATLRFDVNDRWLWKLEAHLIDGTADLPLEGNPDPERYWGLFLFKTTLTF